MTADLRPPANRMAIALLSLAGAFVAFYLFAHALGWTGPIVCGVGDCATVQASSYAKVGPIPVAAIGLAGYMFLLGMALLGLQPAYAASRVVSGALVAASSVALAFSAYLTYLEAAVIHAWCQWCVVSAILVVLIFLFSLPEVGRLRQSPARGHP
ncbi:MAG: vitamin K epoxide reductase family protein [Gemmatimonadota bacterium]|nr:vitamin K epoxide reductase family protein [Gemmatimonadota bacterium]